MTTVAATGRFSPPRGTRSRLNLPTKDTGASQPFIPNTTLQDCIIWLDCADTSKITDAGAGAVSQMVSKDSGAKVWSQATGSNRPTTGTRTINGRNVLDFDGGDILTYLTNISLANNSGALTSYMVAQADTIATYRSPWTADKSTGGGDRLTQGSRSATTTELTFSWFNTNSTIWGVSDATGLASLVTNPWIVTCVFGGTTAKTLDIYRDSTHVGTQQTSAATPRTASANWGFGGVDLSDLTHGFDGRIAEWIVYNADHEAQGHRSTVETYLRNRWGTP